MEVFSADEDGLELLNLKMDFVYGVETWGLALSCLSRSCVIGL